MTENDRETISDGADGAVGMATEQALTQKQAMDRIAQLTAELETLRREQSAQAALSERMTRECAEFEAHFPAVAMQEIPDDVWEKVHGGVPLAAAYALYAHGQALARRRETQAAERMAQSAAGLPGDAAGGYFSPSQVRAMSRAEVRDNYDRVLESMRHWQ